MRIMSFNVRGAYWVNDGVNHWPKRADLNSATIRKYTPDVIGFQEFQQGNHEYYQTALAEYRWSLGPRYGNRAPFEYPAIAWNSAKLRLCGVGGFWLSSSPQVYSGAWRTDCIRSAQWARFQPVEGGRTWVFLNTHLDHVSELARLEGARLIIGQLAAIAPDEPLVITGDFNCDPGTPPYQAFAEAGLVDCFLAAGGTDGPESLTFHGFKGRGYVLKDGRTERIDWILARGMKALSCDSVRDEDPPRYPSDHYPVLAEVGDGL
jgi:endonuclease/exonuclease/phosphatase family metal-dependent hydrolase